MLFAVDADDENFFTEAGDVAENAAEIGDFHEWFLVPGSWFFVLRSSFFVGLFYGGLCGKIQRSTFGIVLGLRIVRARG